MNNFLHTKKILGISVAVALAAVAGYLFVFIELSDATQRVRTLVSQIDLQTKEEARLVAAQDVLANTSEDRLTLRSYFLEEDAAVSFIETIETLGVTSNTDISISSVEVREEASRPLNVLSVRFSARGSWEAVFHALSLAEMLPFASEIERFDIENVGREDEDAWRGIFLLVVAFTS